MGPAKKPCRFVPAQGFRFACVAERENLGLGKEKKRKRIKGKRRCRTREAGKGGPPRRKFQVGPKVYTENTNKMLRTS